MKRQLLAILLVCTSAALSQAGQAANSQIPAPSIARQQVLDTTNEWIAAENRHDAAALSRILDDQFISTFAANNPIDKEAFIKGITSGTVDPTQSQSLADTKAVVDGDTAVITGTDTFHSAAKSGPAFRYTITYIYRDGHWRALAEHIVTIPANR